ncbi:MAG TPA: bacillithiol system redox-active protein YtxJ [Planctomycetota bacterium]|jgi:bacillithiol system protein YtxJ
MAKVEMLNDIIAWELLWNSLEIPGAGPVLIFKRSPRCATSLRIEQDFQVFVKDHVESGKVRVRSVDVIASRAVSQKIATDTGVTHESPQALLLGSGQKVLWHASHQAITEPELSEAMSSVGAEVKG